MIRASARHCEGPDVQQVMERLDKGELSFVSPTVKYMSQFRGQLSKKLLKMNTA